MNKTEKLREKLGAIEEWDGEWAKFVPLAQDTIDQILKACKEAGMVLDKKQSFPQIQIHGVIILPEELERSLPSFSAVEDIEI